MKDYRNKYKQKTRENIMSNYGFWQKKLGEIFNEPNNNENSIKRILASIKRMEEDWLRRTVSLFFEDERKPLLKDDVLLLEKIFGTSNWSIGSTEKEKGGGIFENWMFFQEVNFPKIETPQGEEGGKHC
ncbi:MAG: hypothetical protein PHX25_02045 [Candidatus Pacebacteria bacterium]|nr:hypothetical protein [Candidatus Paceibacterota bacterium]